MARERPGVTTIPTVLVDAVLIEQDQLSFDFGGELLAFQKPSHVAYDGQRVAAASLPRSQMYVEFRISTALLQETRECPLARTLPANENYAPTRECAAATCPPTARHCSAQAGNAANRAGPVFGINADVAPQPVHILRTVDLRIAVTVFLDDKQLFFLAVI